MKVKRLCAGLMLALILTLWQLPHARAAQVDSGDIYCFSSGDFPQEELTGICLTGISPAGAGQLRLGSRTIRPGDILTADQLRQLTFQPRNTEADKTVTVHYLPVFSDRVESSAELTISIRGRENQSPVAEDFAGETYRNLSLEGQLKVSDPEGEALEYTLVRGPRRGTVELGYLRFFVKICAYTVSDVIFDYAEAV